MEPYSRPKEIAMGVSAVSAASSIASSASSQAASASKSALNSIPRVNVSPGDTAEFSQKAQDMIKSGGANLAFSMLGG